MAHHRRASTALGTTLDFFMCVPEFAQRFHIVNMPDWEHGVGYRLQAEIRLFLEVLRSGLNNEGLLLYTGRGRFKPEMLATCVMSFFPRRNRARVILFGEGWEPNTGWRAILDRIIIRLVDRAVSYYALLSNDERLIFPHIWGIRPDKVRFVPCGYSFRDQDIPSPTLTGDYVFTGGNSFRDYQSLLAAARAMPERQFIFATNRLDDHNDLPPNVRAGQVPPDEFIRLMCRAAVVVVPLRTGTARASGQQTILNSMRTHRLTIVNAALGVHDYVRHRENGIVVSGSPESYVEALYWAFNPSNAAEVERMIEQGYQDTCNRFNLNYQVHELIALMDQALADDPVVNHNMQEVRS